jgi:hypothetical protein
MSGKRAESLGDVPDEFMRCRAWRQHLFVREDDSVSRVSSGGVVEVERWRECARCGYEVTTTYAVTRGRWTVLSAKPIYPDSYLVRGGTDRDDVRNEYLSRLSSTRSNVRALRRGA